MACFSTQTITSTILTSWNTTCPNGRKNVLQVYWIQEHVFNDVWHSERVGTLLYVIFAQITFWAVVSGVLHKLGIYWKLWEAEFTSGNRKFDTLVRFTCVIQIFKVCLFMVFSPINIVPKWVCLSENCSTFNLQLFYLWTPCISRYYIILHVAAG